MIDEKIKNQRELLRLKAELSSLICISNKCNTEIDYYEEQIISMSNAFNKISYNIQRQKESNKALALSEFRFIKTWVEHQNLSNNNNYKKIFDNMDQALSDCKNKKISLVKKCDDYQIRINKLKDRIKQLELKIENEG